MRKPAEFVNHPVPFPANPCYRAVVKHVVDGDTFDVFVDLGMYEYSYVTIRLAGLDAPEINNRDEAERKRGIVARDRARELVLMNPVRIVTQKDKQSFGRFIADVFYIDARGVERSLAEVLRAEGHVK